jgi:hypothetical protein
MVSLRATEGHRSVWGGHRRIYLGVFTATEAGAPRFRCLLAGLTRRGLTWKKFAASIVEAGKVIAMTFYHPHWGLYSKPLHLLEQALWSSRTVVGLNLRNLLVMV